MRECFHYSDLVFKSDNKEMDLNDLECKNINVWINEMLVFVLIRRVR